MSTTNLCHECKSIKCPSGCGNWVLLNVIWNINLFLLLWPEKTTPSDQCTFWSDSWCTAVQKNDDDPLNLWLFIVYIILQRAALVMLEWVSLYVCVLGEGHSWKVWRWSLMFNYLLCLNLHSNNDWQFKAWGPPFYPKPYYPRVTTGKPQHIYL